VAAARGFAMTAAGEGDHGALRELVQAARGAGRFALDTEFMGEGRYRTLLCLVQLGTPQAAGTAERIELLDPLAQDIDPAPLAAILADPEVGVVVHAGRQDVALVRRRFDCEVRNVFDTQVAAGFAGLGAQSSYESLLAELLGVRIAKSASFTRWDTRPLTAEQRAYAREDVVHLLELAAELERRLVALGRLEWALEECQALELANDERDPQAIFERLPRVRGLSASARPVAHELVLWREEVAARQDRPVQSILSDPALMEIARRKPSTRAELEHMRGAAGSVRRRAAELLDAVERGRARPPEAAPQTARTPLARPEDAPLVALAETLVRAHALRAGIAYELIASRNDLQTIVSSRRNGAGEPDVRVLRGWRRELVGRELLRLLDGRVSLSIAGEEVHIASAGSAQPMAEKGQPGRAPGEDDNR
jgi:ribonuclease D